MTPRLEGSVASRADAYNSRFPKGKPVDRDKLEAVGPREKVRIGWETLYKFIGQTEAYIARRVGSRQYEVLSYCPVIPEETCRLVVA